MNSYEISNYEYCKNVSKITTPHPKSIKAYIPKYMPNITGGDWKQKVSIGGSLFVNAPDCAVNIPNIIMEQGYYTVPTYSNETLDFSSKFDEDKKCIPIGTTFLLETLYNDPETVRLTGKV